MERPKMAPKEREVSVAVSNFLLCAVALMAAYRARKVNLGSAAGFLMQACAGFLGSIYSCSQAPSALLTQCQREMHRVATVIGLPLLSFGFHWLNGDRLAANSAVTGGIVAAACSDYLGEESRELAVRTAIAAPLLSVLAVCIFTANLCGVAVSLSGVVREIGPGRLLGLKKADLLNFLLTSGIVALQRALDTQHRAGAA
ncbi:transmembrane protein 276-like [Heptranchias perlo]|uniref:transmembrane protein 276-like n=1 Tax=Heptranchias perlo TaxID=212740 RepID=UPI003559ED7F